ncbi:hypothetical protein GALL_509600 [mine drainage metagenome]|uniref:Uncharacterized protein n=1 Tax=mine drainage metagenome TaxID=410659 RepID=A0A1J5P888_9ZZZZ
MWFPWQRPRRHLDCNAVDRGMDSPSRLPKEIRPRSARPRRKIDERQSAQFRPLGHYCLAAIGIVHALPESWSARVLAGHLLLAASDRGRSESRSRRRHPGAGDSRHVYQWIELPDLRAERPDAGLAPVQRQGLNHREAARRQRAVVRVAAGFMASVHRADRGVDLPVAADAGRCRQGDGVRQVSRQDADRGARPRDV